MSKAASTSGTVVMSSRWRPVRSLGAFVAFQRCAFVEKPLADEERYAVRVGIFRCDNIFAGLVVRLHNPVQGAGGHEWLIGRRDHDAVDVINGAYRLDRD